MGRNNLVEGVHCKCPTVIISAIGFSRYRVNQNGGLSMNTSFTDLGGSALPTGIVYLQVARLQHRYVSAGVGDCCARMYPQTRVPECPFRSQHGLVEEYISCIREFVTPLSRQCIICQSTHPTLYPTRYKLNAPCLILACRR